MTATERRFYCYAVARASCRDRLYFGSDQTAAAELGLSRRTIIRCRQSLEAQGWLTRCGYRRWGKLPNGAPKLTVCYRFPRTRVTERTSCRRSNPTTGIHYVNPCRAQARSRGRRRRIVQNLEKQGQDTSTNGGPLLVVRRNGEQTPFNAHDALAATFEMYPAPIAPRWRGRLGRDAKELLGAGFPPDVVVAALLSAMRRGRPGLAQDMAGDLMNAKLGLRQNFRQFQAELDMFAALNDPETGHIYRALRGEPNR